MVRLVCGALYPAYRTYKAIRNREIKVRGLACVFGKDGTLRAVSWIQYNKAIQNSEGVSIL